MPSSTNLEYIPIHTSDRGSFKRCRRRWQWTSPIRSNLRPKLSEGISFPLWFGTGIHEAVEKFYDPVLRQHPSEVWNTYYHDTVRVLQQVAPDFYSDNEEEFLEHLALGIGMTEFYKTYSEANDNFDVIAVEEDFAVPLELRAVDPRDGKTKDVRFCGRRDIIIQDKETGLYGLMDHKTTARIDEDDLAKLEMDEQCTGYLLATHMEGKYEPQFITYNLLRKACPKPPTVLYSKDGSPRALSVARATESTTAEMFEAAVKEHRLHSWFVTNEKAQGYLEWLREVGDDNFIFRQQVFRNNHEILGAFDQIRDEAMDMLGNPSLYPNPSATWYCTKCPLRAACLAMNDGSDYNEIISNGFEVNPDR